MTWLPSLSSANTWVALTALGSSFLAINACSSESSTSPRQQLDSSGNGSGAASGATTNVGAINVANNNATGIIQNTSTDGSGGTAPRDPRCDDQGNCSCINIGMIGRNGTYGAVPGEDSNSALVAWLNENSSAAAQSHLTKPTLTTEFLADYDVLILQALETPNPPGADGMEVLGTQWQFSADESAALEAWVRAGGGIIALTGYGRFPEEAAPSNALLAFSGLQYAGLTGSGDTAIEGSCPNECCYCYGASIPSTGWIATHPISANLTAVGAYYGRSIAAPATAEVVARTGTTTLGATVQADAGRVFMFHDEWVTYTSQWDGTDLVDDCRTEQPNHSCYDKHPANDYQVRQFWYNALKWASGDAACFDIRDPEIIK